MIKKYDNGTSYSFITKLSQQIGKKLVSLNEMLFNIIEAESFDLDWNHIETDYKNHKKKYGKVDIDIFSFEYVLGYSLLNNFAHNEVKKEAMYLHIKAELQIRETHGKLD